ncbi:ABC transporter ATP-binding protein [Bogoriella caseilytica]|uniref:Teichoic acid transport system ATP-binding protein n=1 Tax=Bogoriella caseilytica TaxID=56055 RepID=A0A3N2BAC6_9MICO|nr:ABC transporter ATP-binding protein [Bogoriella caseilytica]ROR72112.1 teichoic acid transport system ATP-binding protein [Bogoriella caseilytica]
MAETEIDFEYDAEDFAGDTTTSARIGAPSVVVDNVHVKYRVFGSKKTSLVDGEAGPSRLRRLRNRMKGHVGAVSEVHAVKGVSFVAHRGESIGIVGTNGSGKSTLLRAAAGLVPLAEGRIWTEAKPSLLGVNAALVPALTGERNIMIGGLALGLSPQEVRERTAEIIDFADLGDFVHLPMKTYSSGMAARLRFAISSVARPDILMIDEALSTGDAEFRQKSKARIDEIREHAGTIFLVTHSSEAIIRMCSRVIWIKQGQVEADGDPDEVTQEYRKYIRTVRADQKAAREAQLQAELAAVERSEKERRKGQA